ncbi:MAG: SDR family oxidoreductase [Myxococcales bacterium]
MMTTPASPRTNDRILVVGATGLLGMEIVRLLCDAQKRVRAVVRDGSDPAKRAAIGKLPVESVAADLKDPRSLEAACEGVNTVISTATAIMSRREGDSLREVDELGQVALVGAARKAGVRHLVFLSFLPNDLEYDFQRAKRRVEAELRASGISFTVLQPAAFMEIWLSPALGFDPVGGRARILGDGNEPVSWVSTHDVARFAVAASEGGLFAGKTVPLGGPDALSPLQVINIFEGLGPTRIGLEYVPQEALRAMLDGARNPVEQALAASMLATARGQVINPQPAQDLLPGRMVSVRDYASRLLGPSR